MAWRAVGDVGDVDDVDDVDWRMGSSECLRVRTAKCTCREDGMSVTKIDVRLSVQTWRRRDA
jgi:hypothetical protein